VERKRLMNRWRPLGFLGVQAVVCGTAFVLVYRLTVRTISGRLLGDASLRGAILTNPRTENLVNSILNIVSVASLLGATAVIALIALLRLRRSLGLAAVGLLVGANASTWLLKNVVLSRPDLNLQEITPATLNSMPSGHSTAVFSAVAALLFVLPAHWRAPAALLGAGYSILTALATMSAGWHRAGDSVAAILVVGVWAAIAAMTVVVIGDPKVAVTRHRLLTQRPGQWLAIGAAGSLTLGTIVVLTLFVDARLHDSGLRLAPAFLAGGLLITGTATTILVAILVALDQIAPPPAVHHA
jgi:membrane-associated phospholipid phosphatase